LEYYLSKFVNICIIFVEERQRLSFLHLQVECYFFVLCTCSQHHKRRTYFYSGFIAYFLGLVATIFVMHYFKHAQVINDSY